MYLIEKIKNIFKRYDENIFERKDITNFFQNLDTRFKSYIQVSIIKPDSLVESGDTSFNQIDIYNHYVDISLEKRLKFHNMIKTYHQKYINSHYVIINDIYDDKRIQPLVFTAWYLGEEIRIGCFLRDELINNISSLNLTDLKENIETNLKVFVDQGNIQRNTVNRNTH